jgi:hypothetical protein
MRRAISNPFSDMCRPVLYRTQVEVALKGLGHVETGCVPAGFVVHETMDEQYDVLPRRLLKIDPGHLLRS